MSKTDYNLLEYILVCLYLDSYATRTSAFVAQSLDYLTCQYGDDLYKAIDQLKKEMK